MTMKTFYTPLAGALALALLAASSGALAKPADSDDPLLPRIAKVLKATPLIDGHNDWPMALTEKAGDARWTMDLNQLDSMKYDTDIERMRTGMMGGQFWSVYVDANLPGLQQIKTTLEQIDLVHHMIRRNPKHMMLARSAADVRRAHKAGRVASMLGVEGGGQFDESFPILRTYAALGVGYMTLTHNKTIAWADAATDAPLRGGLTPYGKEVVREMNRLNMLVDLSHVSPAVMMDAIATSRAPVIFSHSSARAVCNHPRNVPDDVLRRVAQNGGVVMVNFAPQFVSEARRVWGAERLAAVARTNNLYLGQPDGAKAAMAEWDKANSEPVVTVQMVADHIDHIAKVAGHDHVGIGADYDGLPKLPENLDGVESYPRVFIELAKRGWSDVNLAKLAGSNILRVMEAAEKVAATMTNEPPATGTVSAMDGVVSK
jgi:membrane dipeptidase